MGSSFDKLLTFIIAFNFFFFFYSDVNSVQSPEQLVVESYKEPQFMWLGEGDNGFNPGLEQIKILMRFSDKDYVDRSFFFFNLQHFLLLLKDYIT